MVRTDFVDNLGPRYYQLQIKCTIEPGFSLFSVLLILSNHFSITAGQTINEILYNHRVTKYKRCISEQSLRWNTL